MIRAVPRISVAALPHPRLDAGPPGSVAPSSAGTTTKRLPAQWRGAVPITCPNAVYRPNPTLKYTNRPLNPNGEIPEYGKIPKFELPE